MFGQPSSGLEAGLVVGGPVVLAGKVADLRLPAFQLTEAYFRPRQIASGRQKCIVQQAGYRLIENDDRVVGQVHNGVVQPDTLLLGQLKWLLQPLLGFIHQLLNNCVSLKLDKTGRQHVCRTGPHYSSGVSGSVGAAD